ncbi:hypothetical protein [Mycolicibacterium sphagni]|uniref:Uncharacterized protein n=1 Tax=Mycolicibacterium sphagni TaxID=1786 RepID=A0A255DJH8_9MYCO|nr:hypothetical protein [Mycolicibacterium sphagni]MCV7176611.1 hypothetical protein [Mycolicibacterium sphagni]OYN79548.1 hypothetical protein CG716_11625 [Mycolicibacterium sphagni]
MNVKTDFAKGAVAAVLGLSALGLGAGAGIASADPGQPCWQQNCQGNDHGGGGPDARGNGGDNHQWGNQGQPDQWRPDQGQPDQWRPDQGQPDQWRPDQGWDQRPWDQRGIDDARFDHQPFNWQGQRVEPYWDQDRGAWGFQAFGIWIPM